MSRLILKICINKFKSLPRDENGAAMMITLAVILFLYLLCSSSYAIGMTINEKIQLQNACDAAAYSAAVVEADGLSRIATINRAMSWTYTQTVKRRMDYIVLEWLNLVKKNFDEDVKACEDFNSKPYKIAHIANPWAGEVVAFAPQDCDAHTGKRGAGRWWVGWSEEDDYIRLGYVTDDEGNTQAGTQYGRFVPYQALIEMEPIKSYQTAKANLTSQIEADDELLNTLEVLMLKTIYAMNEQMETAALEVLRRNLPEISSEEYYYRILLPNFVYPYPQNNGSGEALQGVLSPYRNTEEDELEFLAASSDQSSYHDIFGDGIDQWFIRESESSLNNDGTYIQVDPADYVLCGIQRGYKNANRIESSRVVGASRGNHVAYGDPVTGSANLSTWVSGLMFPQKDEFKSWPIGNIPADGLRIVADCLASTNAVAKGKWQDILPSCLNSNNHYIEQCLNEKNNYGLVAEYHWASLRWWCGQKTLFIPIFGGIFSKLKGFNKKHFMRHYKVSSITACSHDKPSNVTDNTRAGYDPCVIGIDMHVNNTHNSSNSVHGYGTMGYSRIYGDDKRIYNEKYYITPRVRPVKLNHSYFQERINVAAGKKQKNPFYWLFSTGNTVRTAAPKDSVYALFNPTLISSNQSQSMLVATSSATAAFRSRRREGHYETNYDQLTSFEYDPNYDADIPPIRLEHNVKTPSVSSARLEQLRIGCVHKNSGNKIGERLSKVWNLCETDWQAVFVPHRYADENWIGAGVADGNYSPYDSFGENTEVWYRSYPQELTIYSNFLIGLGFPNENGVYMKPLYGSSTGNGKFNVRHPASRNESHKDYVSEELGLFLLKFKLQ